MKRSRELLLSVTFVLGMLSLGLQAQGHEAQVQREQELRQVEKKWDTAIVARDIPVLDDILNDDFQFIDSAGNVHSKAEILEGIKSSKATTEPFETEDVQVRVYGTTAILTGRFTQRVIYEGKTYTGQFRYTDVYVKREGSWRAVSAHASRIPEKEQ